MAADEDGPMGVPTTVVGRSTEAHARAAPETRDDRPPSAAISVAAGHAAPIVLPVIRSKIEPPSLRDSTLSRQRLIDRLTEAVTSRVTLLVAEAGYGKTTLLADFSARAGIRCLWYRLDSTDRDWITLVNYLIAAVREIEPDFGQSTSGLLTGTLTGEPPKDTVIASLLGELQQLRDAPTVLILDDFQAVDESPDATELVARLIRDAPSSMSFVLSSRSRPPLLLARLAGMGELAELSTEDLRFSITETEQLFADGYKQPLDADVLTVIDARTEGWAASLQLFYSSTHGRTSSAIRSLARSLTGASGQLYDFLAEEVLSNLPDELADFLLRSALLLRIVPDQVAAVFPVDAQPSSATLGRWFEEADRLGVFSRTSSSSEARQLHPLLREFLLREVAQRLDAEEIRSLHFRVARGMENVDPLVACHHYIEASEPSEAMRCLGGSVLLTMGSGRAGVAAQLIKRLEGVPADPAVVAIQARQLMEEGGLAAASDLMAGTDLAGASPEVRAVFRQTGMSLAWRRGDRDQFMSALHEIEADPDTPPILRDISRIYTDSNVLSQVPATFPALAHRLEGMAASHSSAGHHYYAAIALHNATVAHIAAGRYANALSTAEHALETFNGLPFRAPERCSTTAMMAIAHLESGLAERAHEDIGLSLSSGEQSADVPAVLAMQLAVIGDLERSRVLLRAVEELEQQGRSDMPGAILGACARGFLELPDHPTAALELVPRPSGMPLDFGLSLQCDTLSALALLLAKELDEALRLAERGLGSARRQSGGRFEVRLALIAALATEDPPAVRRAIVDAAALGELGILEVADAIGQSLFLLTPMPGELDRSIARWPARWLPILRRQLEAGGTANARSAATLLDKHGEEHDIGRLRAYEKTYLRPGRAVGLGRALARRVSPALEIHDLGRVSVRVADRAVMLGQIRRKPASLLMYLVTRPNFTAPREQILDELWPDSRPVSASNSLNQSLYFLRRDIDPWYEDDVSVEYVAFEGDLLWLDPELVRADSADFVEQARAGLLGATEARDALRTLDSYEGQFCPEFEYEDWAISWRTRVHASYLNFGHTAVQRLVAQGNLPGARDVALRVLASDPTAADMESGLVWIYWQLGATSAAAALHHHIEARDRADGLDPPSLDDLISGDRPH